jgi:hypothetical protein
MKRDVNTKILSPLCSTPQFVKLYSVAVLYGTQLVLRNVFLLYLINLILSVKQLILGSSSHAVIFIFLFLVSCHSKDPNILLSTFFSNILNTLYFLTLDDNSFES